MKFLRALAVVVCLLSLPPSSQAQDRTEADFVKACLASSNLSQEICACSGKKAKVELDTSGFALLVAMLEGDETKTEPLRKSAGLEQVMKAGTFMARGPAQCAKQNAPAAPEE